MAVEYLFPNSFKIAISRTIRLLTSWRTFWLKDLSAIRTYCFGSFKVMYSLMLMECYQFKIFNSIIGFIFINVMYHFVFTKGSAKIFGHYKNLFRKIAVFPCVWMIRHSNINIATSYFRASALPTRISFTFPTSFWPSHNGSITLIRGYGK